MPFLALSRTSSSLSRLFRSRRVSERALSSSEVDVSVAAPQVDVPSAANADNDGAEEARAQAPSLTASSTAGPETPATAATATSELFMFTARRVTAEEARQLEEERSMRAQLAMLEAKEENERREELRAQARLAKQAKREAKRAQDAAEAERRAAEAKEAQQAAAEQAAVIKAARELKLEARRREAQARPARPARILPCTHICCGTTHPPCD